MIETVKKSCKELLVQRMLLASVSSVTLQFFLVCCLVLFANLSADYVHWLHATWLAFTSLRMWIYLLILTLVTFLQGYLCSKIYLRSPSYHKSRFARLCAILTTQNLLLCASYIVIGGVLVWLYLSLMGGKYSSPVIECSIGQGKCLAERYYFLLLSGCWSGLYYSVKNNNVTRRYFRFPIIAQSKFSRLRRSVYTILPTLILSSIWSTMYYTMIYFFLGSYYRTALYTISVRSEPSEALDTVSRLLNFMLISRLWLYQFLFVLTISSIHLLFEVYMTEWVWFKIGTSGAFSTDDPELTLADAISMDKVPIMQHLGYLDLVNIAQKEQRRRILLFTLSQPGGHPYNWNCVVQRCMNLLKNFTIDLNTICLKPQDRIVYSSPTLTTTGTTSMQHNDYLYRMRKLVQDIPPPTMATCETGAKETVCNSWCFQKFIKQKRDAFVAYLLSKPLINYIFGEQEDHKIRYVLSNGQLVIWAAEAISSLTVFSLTEDSYGIVQKDVPTIIYVLLSVKQALDKLHKSSMSTRKVQTDDKLIREIFMSLRSAIKRSLYRIVTNFEPYINELYLEPVKIEQLQSYFNYKE
ncbi:nucleoporin NDC1 [Harpegnathos saltator]|uniref:Nucleoporin Ndc1 n=1 Tax=Harpegnathos saltator TaxID=610380 RepID=E2BZ02_HARSA|nr:nucleoporin NDC1 [Harpegnathos saltator]EFN79074.1 Nucleoporin Ndc1 [Harpegnathos saltator]